MDKQYRYFYEVARQGSIKAAADKLFISQPSLTTAIKKLEEQLGADLFVRKSKGVELTEYGWVYFRYVQEVQEKHIQMMHQLSDMKLRSGGKVKLGIGEAWWQCFGSEAVQQFTKQFPNSSMHIEFGNGLSMLHHLINDDIDLFVGHEIIGINTRHRVRFIPLFQEREAWYVRPEHPLRGEANIADKAKDYPLVKVTPDHARHGDVLTEEGAELFTVAAQNTQVTYELDSLSASIDMVKMSNAIMPYTSEMEAFFVNQGLALLWLNKKQLGQVGIYTKVGDFTTPTQALIDLIIKKAES
ncbi:LysR family transcriptional regulator [Vibrio tubiashii]|uniref:DNA-binding transcriptional regulator n=1 Tax=Vibrio tubiashii ATCC 19109 TaxID=1051646 RepID=F9T8D8_9VIBR|nr:LysR family transcriptional regulator [Vibrio tubiashii]AIW16043.1 LysR family transcriptional regulator [Vibrio tubiashii ATCC 19109]EGU52718.1 DNA-binding transcriptional regulator [Vibrio tubiashii ATCC 19109]EIF03619.1 DNA-binding transcriptional regulator [Vibrio tubiashii NCIMB 1337 = ATCC 19106]